MTKIAVYLSGSIAAYKGVMLVRELQKAGHQVRVVMTPAATRLVTPATLASLTHYPVLTDLWEPANEGKVPHIELADWSELAVVAPASADIIAKLAHGIADDAATTTLLATQAPIIVVPAMNSHMLAKPSVQRNLQQLRMDGCTVMDTDTGYLAEGYSGKGRFPEPDQIAAFILKQLETTQLLKGKKVLVTAGGTVEYLDPVRYLGNRSSGKMGIAIAQAAAKLGADVTLVTGRLSTSLPLDPRIHTVSAMTSEEMLAAVDHDFSQADVLVMAAAVADFKPQQEASEKIKKQAGQNEYQLTLQTTTDILATMGRKKRPNQLVVGFAAESSQLISHAQEKLTKKHADMIVANNIKQEGIGFNADDNQVTILETGLKPDTWPIMSKAQLADRLMEKIAQKLQ